MTDDELAAIKTRQKRFHGNTLTQAYRDRAALLDEVERLKKDVIHWREAHRLASEGGLWFKEQMDEALAAEALRSRIEIERLLSECFRLAANQCHAGYAGENGDHRCRYRDDAERMRSECAAIMRDWGLELDENLTECVVRNIDGWKQRALKAEAEVAALREALMRAGAKIRARVISTSFSHSIHTGVFVIIVNHF